MPVPAYYGSLIANPDAVGTAPIVLTDQYIGPVYPPRIFGLGTTLTWHRTLTLDAQADYQGGAWLDNFIGYQNALRSVWQPCYALQPALKSALGPDGKANTADDVQSAATRASACAISAMRGRPRRREQRLLVCEDRLREASLVLARVRTSRSGSCAARTRRHSWWPAAISGSGRKYDGADPEANDAVRRRHWPRPARVLPDAALQDRCPSHAFAPPSDR